MAGCGGSLAATAVHLWASVLEVASLVTVQRVLRFGAFWGYEWLVGLSAGVHREVNTPLPPSELQLFLAERQELTVRTRSMPCTRLASHQPGCRRTRCSQYATDHGRTVRQWARDAFSGIDGPPIPLGQSAPAHPNRLSGGRRTPTRTDPVQSRLLVNSIDGKLHWARGYTTLHERVAIELEDLAVRRPRPRICALCERPFVPLRSSQRVCAYQPLGRTHPPHDRTMHPKRRPPDLRRGRRASAQDCPQDPLGTNESRTKRTRRQRSTDPEAIREWDEWLQAIPSPRPRGRPRTADAIIDAPSLPTRAP